MKSDIISQQIQKIQSGNFGYENLFALFIPLRDKLAKYRDKEGYAILYDIFDGMAHSKRNQGLAFEHSKKLIYAFVDTFKHGGTVFNKTVDFDFSKSFENVFALLEIEYDKETFIKQIPKIKQLTYENFLKDTILEINVPEIESSSIILHTDGNLYISFKMKQFSNKIGNLTVEGSPRIQVLFMT